MLAYMVYIISQEKGKMEKQSKNSRRKRKDPESRDFQCKCGKGYLSYAAAYTHVKTKHQLEKEFVDNIKKPEREQLKRGRPKEKKQNSQTLETSMLTLIESAILKICKELEGSFENVILQGNEERNTINFNSEFSTLINQRSLQLREYNLNEEDRNVAEFSQILNKDFSTEVAIRIKLAILVMSQLLLNDDSYYMNERLRNLNLWKGKDNTNAVIIQAFNEWTLMHQKYQHEDSDYVK